MPAKPPRTSPPGYNLELRYGLEIFHTELLELFARSNIAAATSNYTVGANLELSTGLTLSYEAIINPNATDQHGSNANNTTQNNTLQIPGAPRHTETRYLPYLRQSNPELFPYGDPGQGFTTLRNLQQTHPLRPPPRRHPPTPPSPTAPSSATCAGSRRC